MIESRTLALRACLECIKQDTGLNAVYEYRFHPVRKWRFDVAFPKQRVALEIEGAVWTQGRHTRGKGFSGDMEKYNTATQMGWQVYRCTWQDVESGQATELLKGVLEMSV
jgi:very-short-patch-repair endonuclease